ncbi:uncharacterized protein LOC142231466 [Haematobia irritans]|uniref:uncharacterized protein LOC142231466 n=1 Tax=Haematobia irritans TaxID=7368 RepID=UPI003F506848
MKLVWSLVIVLLATAYVIDARSISKPQKQGRLIAGAVAIKKLVLLKFKKIVPISLILLKSSNENEAELVPVYPTSEIPTDVEFIPTPNGISGHKDVQAIAVPKEFHQQLQAHGMTNLEAIENLLSEAEENENGESSVAVAEPINIDDEPLNTNENDESQPLKATSVNESSVKKSSVSSTRRLSVENQKTGAKAETTIEEIPIYLYSTSDNTHVVKHKIGGRRSYHKA